MTLKDKIEAQTDGKYENIQSVLTEYLNSSISIIPQFLFTASDMYEKHNKDSTLLVKALKKFIDNDEYDNLNGACLNQWLCIHSPDRIELKNILDNIEQFLSKEAKMLYENEVNKLNDYFNLLIKHFPKIGGRVNSLKSQINIIPLLNDNISMDRLNNINELLTTVNILIEKSRNFIEEESFSQEDKKLFIEFKENHKFVAHSNAMLKVFKQIKHIAITNETVLITGETGTGKELVARAIHKNSAKDKEMISVNCGAIQKDIIESELFGHKKGSFSPAPFDRKGHFEMANNSTIFFDEIGELHLDIQVKLLRVLEDGTFMRVGESVGKKSNFRLITATNADLKERIKSKKFRDDLYYRINIFQIHLPPLRERKKDIPYLAHYLYKLELKKKKDRYNEIQLPFDVSHKNFKSLKDRKWVGNIRELKNHIIRFTAALSAHNNKINSRTFYKLLQDPLIDTDDLLEKPNIKDEIFNNDLDIKALKYFIENRYVKDQIHKHIGKTQKPAVKHLHGAFLCLLNHVDYDLDKIPEILSEYLINIEDKQEFFEKTREVIESIIKSSFTETKSYYPKHEDLVTLLKERYPQLVQVTKK